MATDTPRRQRLSVLVVAPIDLVLQYEFKQIELGDLLFVMANVARHLGIDPEGALRDANAKFVRRFRSIEAALRAEGRTPEDATLEEMDQLWDEAKAAEK